MRAIKSNAHGKYAGKIFWSAAPVAAVVAGDAVAACAAVSLADRRGAGWVRCGRAAAAAARSSSRHDRHGSLRRHCSDGWPRPRCVRVQILRRRAAAQRVALNHVRDQAAQPAGGISVAQAFRYRLHSQRVKIRAASPRSSLVPQQRRQLKQRLAI
jgi:hypothetical protein